MQRSYYLDNLKVMLTVLVIAHHAMIPFADGEGTLMIGASAKSGYFRKGLINGEIKKVPVCPAIAVKGNEL